MLPYSVASVRATLAPTWRIPSAKSSLSSSFSLLAAIAANRLSADFSPMRSRLTSCSLLRLYKSAASRTRPASISWLITEGPQPSIFIASRLTKWISPSRPSAGQCGLVQRIAASAPWRSTLQPHSGHTDGISTGFSSPVRLLATTHSTSGMISPALLITTLSPMRISLALIKSSLCSVARLITLPLSRTGVSIAVGVSTPVRPTRQSISSSVVSACSGGYLKAMAQRGSLPVAPKAFCCSTALTLMTAPSVS